MIVNERKTKLNSDFRDILASKDTRAPEKSIFKIYIYIFFSLIELSDQIWKRGTLIQSSEHCYKICLDKAFR